MRCFLLVKFALLDIKDKKALKLLKAEIKRYSKGLAKDNVPVFEDGIIRTPYMCVELEVIIYLNRIDKGKFT